MSAINGDKSRFNRQRKRKIARRAFTRSKLMTAAKAAPSTSPARSKSVSA